MAQILATRNSSVRRPSVVAIQESAAAVRSVYFIYAGSNEFGLARMLGAGINVYCVQVGWPSAWRQALERGDESKYPSMEAVVEPFCSTISNHTGTLPLVIAGFSFAGLMAFETAHQLRARGIPVEAVLLFDTAARKPPPLSVAWNKMVSMWKRGTLPDWGALMRAAQRYCRTTLHRPRPISPLARPENPAVSDRDGYDLSFAWELMEKLYESIRKRYRPRKLDCKGIVVVAESEETMTLRSAAWDLGWKNLFGMNLHIIKTASDHLSIPKEYDRELEQKITAALHQLN
jgi:thioesterase domain-containing protein